MEVCLHVTCHEVRGVHQISRADRRVAETKVRAGETTGFLGIVREICLTVFVGVVTDDLDGVLVGAYRTVCAESVELGLEHAFLSDVDFGTDREGRIGEIVNDSYGELVAGCVSLEILEHLEHLCRCGVL